MREISHRLWITRNVWLAPLRRTGGLRIWSKVLSGNWNRSSGRGEAQFEKPSDQLTRGLCDFVPAKKSLLRCHDLLPLLPQFLNTERHHIAGFEKHRCGLHPEADARRRASDDDVARLHHEKLRAVPHQMLASKDHGLRVAALPLLAIDVEPHVQILRVLDLILGHEPRTDRPESLAALALVPLAAAALDLEHALGYVVAQEISGNGVLCLVLRQIACPLAND